MNNVGRLKREYCNPRRRIVLSMSENYSRRGRARPTSFSARFRAAYDLQTADTQRFQNHETK